MIDIADYKPQEGDLYTVSDDARSVHVTVDEAAQTWLLDFYHELQPDISVGETFDDCLPKEICVWRHPTPEEAAEAAAKAREDLLSRWAQDLYNTYDAYGNDEEDLLEMLCVRLPSAVFEALCEALDATAVAWATDRYLLVERLRVTAQWWGPHMRAAFEEEEVAP
jgi:hypothetical protein